MIATSCRTRITREDLAFLVGALENGARQRAPLLSLTEDPDALDRLLDSPLLFQRLLEAPRLLDVSPYFFYYVVVRRAFLDHGIEDRRAADYVGALLSHHVHGRTDGARPGVYLVDLVREIAEARSAEHAFSLQTEVGDRALYLAGVFPDWIYHRHRYGRRPLDLEYYEEMGSRYYAAAARHEAAARLELADVLAFLAEAFVALRQALNDLVDDHLHIAPRPETVGRLCRQALYRQGR
ncbi:MAG TPA: hypothetical protein VJ788_09065 [Gemmatimonadota bacterium]|nr:hypothetical protein [Gemmatimonadota bacterium]